MKTLVIAANSRTQQRLTAALKQRGHEVTVRENSDGAPVVWPPEGYPLVLLETDGPVEHDVQLCLRLRRTLGAENGVILAVGGSHEPKQLEKLLAAGADDYLAELHDDRQLQIRLAVAEGRIRAIGGHASKLGPLRPLPIKSCPLLYRAPFGVARSNLAGRFLEVNPALVEMLGYDSEEELLGVDLALEVYEDPQVRSRLMAKAPEYLGALELRWKRKDGTPITVRAHGQTICDDTGKPAWLEGIVEDITEEKRAEAALRQTSEELQAIYDGMANGILIVDPESRKFLRVNPAICRMLRCREEELLTMSIPDIHPPEDMPLVEKRFQAVKQRRLSCARDIPCLRKDGSVFYADITANYLIYRGRPCLVGFFSDVTDRKRAELALRESEAMLRSLITNMPDFVTIIDRGGKISFINRTPPELSMEEVIGSDGFQYIVPEHLQEARKAVQLAFQRQEVQTIVCRDVVGRWHETRIVPLVEDGAVEQAMTIATEVTKEKQAAEAVEKERCLLRQLLDLHERDRRLTAYEIHDGFAQQLTAARFNFEAFRRLRGQDSAEARKLFDTGLRLVSISIDETRRLISGLRPPILDEAGIVTAVDYLVCECRQREAPQIEFRHDVRFDRLAPPLESAIFRIIQESLTNACRHSRSEQIRVKLIERNGRVCLSIRDWGIGFDPEDVDERRFGLQGIRERARLLGGEVTIESAAEQGTCISVELPLIEPVRREDQP